jgi:hypothetical protein
VSAKERLAIQGLREGVWQLFRSVTGIIDVITAVLAGSTAGLAAAVASSSLAAALASGLVVGLAALAALMYYQGAAWNRALRASLFEEPEERRR